MTSDIECPREAFVWIWLPARTEPVVAGRIVADGQQFIFNYGQSYLNRQDAIAIFTPELPLQPGALDPIPPLKLANCLRDAAPDAWGRRVIINRLTGLRGNAAKDIELDELTFMLESGSDRVGALDFQISASNYSPREAKNATLDELVDAADRIEKGQPLTKDVALALQHGTAVGGARPKALILDDDTKYIAKFSSSTDTYNVVKAEFIAMRLARLAGLNTAAVQMRRTMHKDVLLVERFDRHATEQGWHRRALVSALTLSGLDEMMAAHASYEDLAETIRHRFVDHRLALRELFGRMTFNILVGNTDDHARNQAAFWDGKELELTPAYDICPQTRVGGEASQGMLIHGNIRRSQLQVCLDAAASFQLDADSALSVISSQVESIQENWDTVCDEADLAPVDKAFLWRRQILNDFAFQDLDESIRKRLVASISE